MTTQNENFNLSELRFEVNGKQIDINTPTMLIGNYADSLIKAHFAPSSITPTRTLVL